jgi:hypothetical protein
MYTVGIPDFFKMMKYGVMNLTGCRQGPRPDPWSSIGDCRFARTYSLGVDGWLKCIATFAP